MLKNIKTRRIVNIMINKEKNRGRSPHKNNIAKLKNIDNISLINKINNDKNDGLIFIAASGVEQIGMNLNLFGYKGKYIVVDVGISFSQLGSGITLPSMNILYDIGPENILAYVITHGHEDHIGGLCRFLKNINVPIYTTAFTMSLIEKKIKEKNIKDTVRIIIEAEKEFQIGPFEIVFTYTAHSIPDSNHIIIRTPNASVFHTGDWKFDNKPGIGKVLDKKHLSQLAGKHGITALINDSTNSMDFIRSGTEGDVYEGLLDHILKCPSKRIIVSCFSSNLARIKSLCDIGRITNRKVVLIGRSLLNMTNIGIEHNLIQSTSNIILDPKKAINLKQEECLYVCTGSQGEINSVLQRCVLDLHPHLKINSKDVVIFSSRVIPGNEDSITKMKNILIEKGVEIFDQNFKNSSNKIIHVTGHPGGEEIQEMILLTGCKNVIPVHGDAVHLYAVQKIIEDLLAKHPSLDLKYKIPIGNGTVFSIHNKYGVEILGRLETYTEVIDGNVYYNIQDDIFRQRAILNEHGVIVIMVNNTNKRNHLLVNYGAVSKLEWEKHLRNQILKIINNSNYESDNIRNQITYFIYKHYDKSPIVILGIM